MRNNLEISHEVSIRRRPVLDADPSPFLIWQRQRLIQIRLGLLESIQGVAEQTLIREGDSSAYGIHQADAGSDAYERDFAIGILSNEQQILREVDEALKRIDEGTYGLCESCGESIPRERLEVLPFARNTVDCQRKLETRRSLPSRTLSLEHHFTIRNWDLEEEQDEDSQTSS